VVGRPAQLVLGERLGGVASHGRQQLPLRTPLRDAHRDLAAAHLGEERLGETRVLGLDRHEHLARHILRGRARVQLLEQARDELARVEVLDLVDHEPAPADDPAAPHEETIGDQAIQWGVGTDANIVDASLRAVLSALELRQARAD
jgi:hypothetical protein